MFGYTYINVFNVITPWLPCKRDVTQSYIKSMTMTEKAVLIETNPLSFTNQHNNNFLEKILDQIDMVTREMLLVLNIQVNSLKYQKSISLLTYVEILSVYFNLYANIYLLFGIHVCIIGKYTKKFPQFHYFLSRAYKICFLCVSTLFTLRQTSILC